MPSSGGPRVRLGGAVYRAVMTRLSHDRYCAEIIAQTELLRSRIEGADLTTPVASCPGWNLVQLLRHLGGAQRWAETIVRTRATQPPSDRLVRDVSPAPDGDAAALAPWLAEGAAQLAASLRAAGPDAPMWTPVAGETSGFYARRMAHETVIHRADATLALGGEVTVDADVAVDAVDEWMDLGALPTILDVQPARRELLGPGRTIHLHATDTAPELAAEWVIDLTGDAIAWRRAHERAAVAIRGPLTDLLLIVYRRRLPRGEGIEVLGDQQLLDFWLERVAFG